MMRKTYGSKKDTVGESDHIDILSTVDDKSSAFDAYYIQNIKQTKRELSSIGSSHHHRVASGRVRKKKYVKRLVKEVEVARRESLSQSVFLTPDKSIHVNKTPDPFDLLLNSSPKSIHVNKAPDPFDMLLNSMETSTHETMEHLFDKRETMCMRAKTGEKGQSKKFRRANSDLNTENSEAMNSVPQNVTDIKGHELFYDDEAKPSPKVDESIHKMVVNLPFWSDLNKINTNESNKKESNENSMNKNSPFPSPLSSTPFNNKHRSKSIFKYSPIPMCEFNDSSITNRSITKETNNKEVEDLIDQNKSIVLKPTNCRNNSNNKNTKNSKSLFSSVEMKSLLQNSTAKDKSCEMKLETSEIEPFPGFGFKGNSSIVFPVSSVTQSKTKSYGSNSGSSDNNDSKQSESIMDHQYTKKDNQEESSFQKENHVSLRNVQIKPPNTTQNTIETEIPNIDLTEKSDNENNCKDHCHNSNSFNNLSFDKNQSETESYKSGSQNSDTDNDKSRSQNSVSSESGCRDSESDINKSNFSVHPKNYSSDECENSDNELTSDENDSLYSKQNDKESQYDTCNSEQSSFTDEDNEFQNESIVSVEKHTNSVLAKYYAKQSNSNNNTDENSLDESNRSIDSSIENESEITQYGRNDTYASFKTQNSDNSNPKSDILSEDDYIAEKDYNVDDNDTSTEPAIERGFVTTRRRYLNEELKIDSLMVPDESVCSVTSSDFDKTVNSIKCNIGQYMTTDNQYVSENALNTYDGLAECQKLDNVAIATPDPELQRTTIKEPRISFDTIRKSAKLSMVSEKGAERKPAIVLQPGKKWERSLSIYRRMTLANENNDQSILDDEEMHSKGRKFRDTVINVINMQPDCNGTLHNDSTKSRRSTLVCRSSRSTIRIVKDTSSSRLSVCSTSTDSHECSFLEGCDDTILELSKLSLEDHNTTVLEKFNEQSRVITSAREYVLRRCNQTDLRPFDECYPNTVLKNCHKIGEGVYGEVYLWRAQDGRARVMKVIPIAGNIRVNGECQKHFHEIISEIVIAMELSALRAPIAEIECHFDVGKEADELDLHAVENATDIFNEVLAVRCVFGSYPLRLLDLWDLYDECKGSENDNPRVLPEDQQYIVLELANAGQDLESYHFNSAEQAHALLLQVAFGLAVGEEAFQFEHRDLHWGNVLIAPTDQKYATFVLRGRSHRVSRRGVAATIIDYSLSRVSLPVAGETCALYNNLAADVGLFEAVGDHQFEVYRLMRGKLVNDWKSFEPYTNVLWLHYLVDKMITSVHYKRSNTKIHKQYISKLKAIKDRVLNYGSAVQFVLTDSEF